jgi:hypothetical protein
LICSYRVDVDYIGRIKVSALSNTHFANNVTCIVEEDKNKKSSIGNRESKWRGIRKASQGAALLLSLVL